MLLATALAPLLLAPAPFTAPTAQLARSEPTRADRQAPIDRPLVLQRHSLAAFLETVPLPSATFPLLPLRSYQDGLDLQRADGEPCRLHDVDTLVDLVRTVVEPQGWESEEWSIECSEAGELLIAAPSEVQAKIGELLATLERDALPSERLEVRVLPGRAPSDGALLVDRATADARFASGGARHSARVGLRDLLPVGAETGVRQDYLARWELDIADSATIAYPERSHWLAGLRLAARATRVEAGALIDLAMNSADAATEMESMTFDAQATHRLDAALAKERALGRIDAPRVGFVSFAGTLLIPDGKVLWLPVTARSVWGTVDCTLEVRCELGGSRVTTVIEPIARTEGEALRFSLRRPLPEALTGFELFRLPIELEAGASDDERIGNRLRGSSSVARFQGVGSLELAQEIASRAVRATLDEQYGCHVALTGSMVRTLLPPAASDRAARALETVSATPRGAVIRGRVRRGEQVAAEFAVPALFGRSLAIWTGVQSRLVGGNSAEIANRVAAPAPRIENFVDGIGMRLELQRGARGELRLGVNAAAQLLTTLPKLVPLGDASQSSQHFPQSAILAIDEWVTLPARGGSVTLGGDVTLELEVIAN